ncbi:hypothetical protein [Rheinheimera sp. MM224]|uniref:hypothetical protein n=1 Tax=Rheinheimera sp. MM224 TaxID=3019969 RepID=UPI0021F86EF1|nr:hypothetical protein [Rheinheimera sp. MM224]CAI3802592.1 hypothetical protein JAMGFMIE_03138 [Rheinheimera sp. MM224]
MRFSIFVMLVTLSSCVSVKVPEFKETRFPTKVSLSEFNNVSGQFIEKGTFGFLMTYPKGEYAESLVYRADGYGSNYNQHVGVTKNVLGFNIESTKINEFLSATSKYLEWESRAKTDGDAFSKDIAKIRYGTEISDFDSYYKLSFHSGNEQSHYLLVSSCSSSALVGEICAGNTALNRANVLRLIEDIKSYQSGQISQKDIASKYQ